MRRKLIQLAFVLFVITLTTSCETKSEKEREKEELLGEDEENEKYDGPREIEDIEFQKTKDPALGRVPTERLWPAIQYTNNLKQSNNYRSLSVLWQERGPLYDSVGPSNGNYRGSTPTGGYAAGRINGFCVDLADPSGNTVFCGGAAGGLWKCTNFISGSIPNWQPINDYMSNLSIVSLCQDPSNNNILYVATGEPWNNLDAVRGNGIFKSIDHGATWTQLSSTIGITRTFKILCDGSGNLYHAIAGSGLRRSSDGGATWTTITPSTVSSVNCTDIELTSTGKLFASFGVGGSVAMRYTTSPSTVTTASWLTPAGFRVSGTVAYRLELAAVADTIYGITCNSSYNVDSCYKSVDGGANFQKMNTSSFATGLANTQGWYGLTLAINPDNTHEIIMGGLDAYKSVNDGQTISRLTYWVSTNPYVHADHHFMQWNKVGESSRRIIIATDGGLFYSDNDGTTFTDRNRNLAIKQFYSCAIHPSTTNYILGGAQDNGSHQFKNAGLSYSTEVTGGDGAYVDIDSNEPQYQFASYVYNQIRRSTDGGNSWSSFNFSSTIGQFINPFKYDGPNNVLYASYSSSTYFRWTNPQTATNTTNATTSTVTLSELAGNAIAITPSPYTANRVFFGSSTGRIVRVDNANTTLGTGYADVTALTTPQSGVNVNCIAIGSDDNTLLAVCTNYGINNLWYSTNGGTSWTGIDGNLPDMPIRWAVFHPSSNSKIVIATEAGVYTTNAVNGASTQWFPSPGFPLVRTDMLKLRTSDNVIVAATHGRGMWTGNILEVLPLKKITLQGNIEGENKAALQWQAVDATNKVQYHVQFSLDGVTFNEIAVVGSNLNSYKHLLSSSVGYYRIMGVETDMAPIFSNIISVKSAKPSHGIMVKINPNPVTTNGNFIVSSSTTGSYQWQLCNVEGRVLQSGTGNVQTGGSVNQPVNVSTLIPGMYIFKVAQLKDKFAASFIKQ